MIGSAREERVVIALLAVAAVILSLLSFLLIRGERRRESLLLEYEAERTAAGLLDAFRDENLTSDLGGTRLLGFGLYTYAGDAVARRGSAPERLDPADAAAGRTRFSHNPARRTLTLLRPLGMASMRPMMGMPGSRRPGFGRPEPGPGQPGAPSSRTAGAPVLLFLEVSTAEYWRIENRFRAAAFVTPVAIIAMASLAGYLYWKNTGYRRRMAEQEQLARLGEVARTLAHEIKNPLGAIRLQTGILRRTTGGQGAREIGLIEEEVGRLALLSDRMAAFVRDPVGSPVPVEVAPFVAGLLERFGGRVGSSVEPDAAAAAITFDPDRLRSVLENLITNALESGTEEPPEVTVAAAGARVEIAVLDRGTGIEPGDAERVFDPFFTRKTRGSGVGLAIARRFAEASGAELRLEPRPGGGTAARLLAPRVQA
jgi:two-component system sensor histidine kinase HydH